MSDIPIVLNHDYMNPLGVLKLTDESAELNYLLERGLVSFEFGGVWDTEGKFHITEVSICPATQPLIKGTRPSGETQYANHYTSPLKPNV